MDTGPFSQHDDASLVEPRSGVVLARDSHAELPLDPDVEGARGRRPVHLRWRYLYVVALGGALGTAARYELAQSLPAPAGLPVPTLLINLVGAFLLGVLLEELVRRGPDRGWLRLARLHFGTGFLGAFTTYSAFALETVHLGAAGRGLPALAYVLVTLVGGAILTTAGIAVAAKRNPA